MMRYFKNWLSLSGLVLTFASLFAFLLLSAIDVFAPHTNPYVGILSYVVAPGFFVLGVLLTAIGAWVQRRHILDDSAESTSSAIIIDLTRTRDRRILVAFFLASAGFLLLTAIGSTKTYHYTESTQFCGQTCHTPMKPEYTAYLHSPHARIDCTECHVGPGATAYLKSKINGVHQLMGVLRDNYQRPIKTPKNLRPAQETCEQCHWSEKFVGNLDRTYSHFLADETNTPFSVRLILKVGGGNPENGSFGGIHWHMNLANKIEYIATDPQRQVIPWVRLTDRNGKVTEYRTPDFKDDPAKHAIKRMDCLDCHNRPAHRFSSPNDAIDHAMALGRIDPSIPWVKSNSVAILIQSYPSEEVAMQKIAMGLGEKLAGKPQLASVVSEVQRIYRANFFPEMRADWRSYPDNLNHKDSAGCFRCHDGLHKSGDGKTKIQSSDCNSCHTILAQGNAEQMTKLNPKGNSFFHIDAINEDFNCNSCHTGSFPKP
jgi:nitrate/TMAO reductase-like tetraheme cytochrome c subunit